MFDKLILTIFGPILRGPVVKALLADLKARIADAEAQFRVQQAALLEEFKVREAAMIRQIAKSVLEGGK